MWNVFKKKIVMFIVDDKISSLLLLVCLFVVVVVVWGRYSKMIHRGPKIDCSTRNCVWQHHWPSTPSLSEICTAGWSVVPRGNHYLSTVAIRLRIPGDNLHKFRFQINFAVSFGKWYANLCPVRSSPSRVIDLPTSSPSDTQLWNCGLYVLWT